MTATGFVFDCDGTLLDTESLWTLAERATVRRFGGRWSLHLKRSFVGRSVADTALLIANHVHLPATDHELVYRTLVAEFKALVASSPPAPLFGADRLLPALAELGVPTGVASNSPLECVDLALTRAGLRPWIATLQTPGNGLRPKPFPDLYAAACDDLSVVAHRSIAAEDSQTGIDAGRAAGLFVLGVPSPFETLDADQMTQALWPLDLPALLRTVRDRPAPPPGG